MALWRQDAAWEGDNGKRRLRSAVACSLLACCHRVRELCARRSRTASRAAPVAPPHAHVAPGDIALPQCSPRFAFALDQRQEHIPGGDLIHLSRLGNFADGCLELGADIFAMFGWRLRCFQRIKGRALFVCRSRFVCRLTGADQAEACVSLDRTGSYSRSYSYFSFAPVPPSFLQARLWVLKQRRRAVQKRARFIPSSFFFVSCFLAVGKNLKTKALSSSYPSLPSSVVRSPPALKTQHTPLPFIDAGSRPFLRTQQKLFFLFGGVFQIAAELVFMRWGWRLFGHAL